MASKQISISRSKIMSQVLAEAYRAFPDAETDGQALTRALCHWYHNREQNSKRQVLERIETMLQEILDILRGDNENPA
jgi:hypothetical protein